MGLNDVRNYIIGAILFSIVIFGGVFVIGSFNSPDLDSSRLSAFNESLGISSEVTATVGELSDTVSEVGSGSSPGALGWLNTLLGSVWGVLRTLMATLGFIGTAISEAGAFFGVPSQIMGLIILIPIIIIVFALIVAIIGVNE